MSSAITIRKFYLYVLVIVSGLLINAIFHKSVFQNKMLEKSQCRLKIETDATAPTTPTLQTGQGWSVSKISPSFGEDGRDVENVTPNFSSSGDPSTAVSANMPRFQVSRSSELSTDFSKNFSQESFQSEKDSKLNADLSYPSSSVQQQEEKKVSTISLAETSPQGAALRPRSPDFIRRALNSRLRSSGPELETESAAHQEVLADGEAVVSSNISEVSSAAEETARDAAGGTVSASTASGSAEGMEQSRKEGAELSSDPPETQPLRRVDLDFGSLSPIAEIPWTQRREDPAVLASQVSREEFRDFPPVEEVEEAVEADKMGKTEEIDETVLESGLLSEAELWLPVVGEPDIVEPAGYFGISKPVELPESGYSDIEEERREEFRDFPPVLE